MSTPTPPQPGMTRRTVDEVIAIHSGVRWRPPQPTTCRLRLYEGTGRPPVAVVTELARNLGLSITNGAEYVWRALAQRLDTTHFVLIEHYGPESFDHPHEPDTFDVVTVDAAGEPSWRPISVEQLHQLLGGAAL